MEFSIDQIEREYNEYKTRGMLLKGKAYDYVKEVLTGRDMEQLCIEGQNLTVSYDGGDHSEYAGNPFSEVARVYIGTGNEVLLETEDCEDYEADKLTAEEMVSLAEVVARETGLLLDED